VRRGWMPGKRWGRSEVESRSARGGGVVQTGRERAIGGVEQRARRGGDEVETRSVPMSRELR